MKVRLLSLNIDKSMSFARFQARIESSIKAYADSLNIQQFEDNDNQSVDFVEENHQKYVEAFTQMR